MEELAEKEKEMSHNLIVTEVHLNRGCEHGRYFRVPVDAKGCYVSAAGVPFDYKSRRSINAFFYNPNKQRNYKGKETLYHVCEESESIGSLKITQEFLPDWPTPNYIDVDSIWDFYKLIGFNNKTKKYE